MGLQRAFAYGGVTAPGVTLLEIDDDPAVFLMECFYGKLGERSAAEALREAMIAATDKFGVVDVPHWAPYILYSDWFLPTGVKRWVRGIRRTVLGAE